MSTKPLFAFFGTPRFAVQVLDALESHGLLPALVVTAPDKPRGRGLELSPCPAKAWALERDIDTLEPATLKDDAIAQELANTDWDLFVVAAYAKLLPKRVLDIPRKGCLNVHPSLLPKFRGPSPARSAILADERETGVSIMLMDERMDAGPVVAQARIALEEEQPGIPGWPPHGSLLEDLLATEGGNLLAETIPPYLAGEIVPEPQDESAATFTQKFTDADARIEFDPGAPLVGAPARTALLTIRTFDASPRAHYYTKEGKRVTITEATLEGGALKLLRVIPEGKKEMPYEDYLRGQQAR